MMTRGKTWAQPCSLRARIEDSQIAGNMPCDRRLTKDVGSGHSHSLTQDMFHLTGACSEMIRATVLITGKGYWLAQALPGVEEDAFAVQELV